MKIELESLKLFRLELLRSILLVTLLFTFTVALSSWLKVFSLGTLHTVILFVYSLLNLLAYVLLKRDKKNYFLSLNIASLSSLVTFTLITVFVLNDEFRMVWFFLTSFAGFILGGKRYGFFITSIIVVIVIWLFFNVNIELSIYALFTFFCALFVFSIFAYYFLKKIEQDSFLLKKRVKDELEKQQLQEQMLLQKYRMANMGEMIDAIAHQWRQPLMQSNMILLNMDDNLDEKINPLYLKEKIVELSKLNTHMSQTIDDFRGLLSDGKSKTNFFLNDVIDEVLRLMKNSLKELTIRYEPKDKIEILGYKNELIQVVITLLSNALEALEGKVNPIISISLDEKERRINIQDNAGGIKNEIIDKIFDPYFTSKKQSGGTGLGLYIAKIIVEQNMHGELIVVNEKEGAKFSIVFGGER